MTNVLLMQQFEFSKLNYSNIFYKEQNFLKIKNKTLPKQGDTHNKYRILHELSFNISIYGKYLGNVSK